jgi:hypothetical protein
LQHSASPPGVVEHDHGSAPIRHVSNHLITDLSEPIMG